MSNERKVLWWLRVFWLTCGIAVWGFADRGDYAAIFWVVLAAWQEYRSMRQHREIMYLYDLLERFRKVAAFVEFLKKQP